VLIGGELTAEGSGRSKKASQQEAAYKALLKIRSTDVS
nr:ribonuclease III [Lachnospiraceae bacterium]